MPDKAQVWGDPEEEPSVPRVHQEGTKRMDTLQDRETAAWSARQGHSKWLTSPKGWQQWREEAA